MNPKIKDNRNKKLVVIQLGGGNDALNTVIPYNDGLYYDYRPSVGIPEEDVIKINDEVGFRPGLEPIKNLWDQGKVAIIQGIGYPNPNRSHFRSMDIWHTALPDEIGQEGWLGQVIRELDPDSENVLKGVNFGRGLPRALSAKDVSVASVGNLDTYGLFPDMKDEALRKYAVDTFAQMYGADLGVDSVIDFLGQTGLDAMKGADILKTAPEKYRSNVEYASNQIASDLRSAAQVMFAELGTQVYYASHGGYDSHSGELATHASLWGELAPAIGDFVDDVEQHGYGDDSIVLVFTEFGRRIKDNGSGTDHGSGGVAFLIGNSVKGGLYGDYPSLSPEAQLEGDLHFNNDFRITYTSILEDWFRMNAAPIVNGTFEKFDLFRN